MQKRELLLNRFRHFDISRRKELKSSKTGKTNVRTQLATLKMERLLYRYKVTVTAETGDLIVWQGKIKEGAGVQKEKDTVAPSIHNEANNKREN